MSGKKAETKNITVNVDNTALVLMEIDHAIKKSLEEVGLTVETAAKKKCPVGTPESTGIPGYKGGTLRNSITHQRENKKVEIGTNVKYGKFVELGTKKMRARSYLKAGIEESANKIKNIFKRNFS